MKIYDTKKKKRKKKKKRPQRMISSVIIKIFIIGITVTGQEPHLLPSM